MSWPQDDLGPAKVVFLHLMDDVDAVVVIDNVALGPAIGGVRLRRRGDLPATEVARLARAMTLKNATAGLPHWGGTSGIAVRTVLDAHGRERVMRAFARAIEQLTDYIPGPDMGTDETAMAGDPGALVVYVKSVAWPPPEPTGSPESLMATTKANWSRPCMVRSVMVPCCQRNGCLAREDYRQGRSRLRSGCGY